MVSFTPLARHAACVAGLAAGAMILCGLFGVGDRTWARIDFNAALYEDFLGPYWETAQRIARREAEPASGYVYPATLAALLAPWTALGDAAESWAVASWLATALIVAAVMAIASGTVVLAGVRTLHGTFAVGLLVAIAHPILHGAYWAQASLFATGLAIAGLALTRHSGTITGGVLIGLAAAIKLFPALFALSLLARCFWRPLLGFVATVALVGVALPLAFLGPDGFVSFHRTAYDGLRHVAGEAANGGPGSQGLRSIAMRVASAEIAGKVAGFVGLGLAIGLLGASWRALRRDQWAVAIALLAAVPWLVLEPVWPHALAWLPLAWVAAWCSSTQAPRWLAGASFALGSAFALRLVQPPTAYAAHALPAASAALAVAALLCVRPSDAPRPRRE